MGKYMVFWWMVLFLICMVMYIYTDDEALLYASVISAAMYAINALHADEREIKEKYNENR